VEPCYSWRVAGDRDTKKLRLLRSMRRCLFVYQYWMDDVFGFLSTRLQTWFPFALYLYTNGRERLARQMDQAAMHYQRHDNCFSWIEDFARAQTLLDEQLKTDWAGALDVCTQRVIERRRGINAGEIRPRSRNKEGGFHSAPNHAASARSTRPTLSEARKR
jgi:hypothetical protein